MSRTGGECNFTALLYVVMMVLIGKIQAAQEYLPPKHGTSPSTAHHLPHSPQGGGKGEPSGEPANYDFSYEVQDSENHLDFGHSEKRMMDMASGSYHVLLPDGRTQIVEYEAGPNGYRPQVRYEGTASSGGGGGGGGGGSRGGGGGGYNYNAASNQAPVRQPAPARLTSTSSPVSTTKK